MMSFEELAAMDESNIEEAAKSAGEQDVAQLVEWLSEKDDKARYKALQLLQKCSAISNMVYPFWEAFLSKLAHENSYQRTIGVMLIAENAKWDAESRMDEAIDAYLAVLHDEKPITARQCIQALDKIIPYKKHLCLKIADALMKIDISSVKETMRKLVLFDVLNALTLIRKYHTTDAIEGFISDALMGGVLDKKAKKLIEAKL